MAYQESVRQEYIQSLVESLQSERKLVLIGTAELGPVNVPTTIYNHQQAIRLFGENGSLIRAYQEMEPLLNASPVCFIKTTGTHGILRLSLNQIGGDIVPGALLLKTKGACELYNQIQIQLEPNAIHVTHPSALGGHVVSYDLTQYGVIGELVAAINEDATNDQVGLYAQCGVDELTPLYEPFYGCNPTLMSVSGASSELEVNKDFYYYCLEETYRILEGTDCHLIVPLDAYFTDILTSEASYGQTSYGQVGYRQGDPLTLKKAGRRVSFYSQLLEFCQKQFELGLFSHGILGFNPTLDKQDEALQLIANESYRENLLSAWFTEQYHHVSVVVDTLYYNYFRSIDSAALAYAAFLHTVDWAKPLTNTPLHAGLSLVHPLSRHIQQSLNQKGFVTFKESLLHDHQLVVTRATTLNPQPGGLSHFYNLRMCQITVSGLNRLVDSYLGWHLDELTKHHRIEKEMEYYLEQLKNIGWITESSANVEVSKTTGEIVINLTIKTAYMVEAIKLNGNIEIAT